MLKASTICLIIAIFIVVIAIIVIVGIKGQVLKQTADIDPPPVVLKWSDEKAGPREDKRDCQLYRFEGSHTTIDGKFVYLPPSPTYDLDTLNNMHGEPIDNHVGCMLPGTIKARQLQHTCARDQEGTDPVGVAQCWTVDKGKVDEGDVEVFYADVNCKKIPKCIGVLSLVTVPPFVEDVNIQKCLPNYPDYSSGQVVRKECIPDFNRNVFLVDRISPGQIPSPENSAQNGPLVKISSIKKDIMNTEKNCLIPFPEADEERQVFFTYASDDTQHTKKRGVLDSTARGLKIAECIVPKGSPDYLAGYVWVVVGNFMLRDYPYKPQDGSDEIKDDIPLPAMLAYIGDKNINDIPYNKPYKNYKPGMESIIWYMIDNRFYVYVQLDSVTIGDFFDPTYAPAPPSITDIREVLDNYMFIIHDMPQDYGGGMDNALKYLKRFTFQTTSLDIYNSIMSNPVCNPIDASANCYNV